MIQRTRQHNLRSATARLAWFVLAVLTAAPILHGQGLAPLNDQPESPLLPASISRDLVELSGQYVYLWTNDAGERVIQYQGNFELLTGARRLRAQNAVVWVNEESYQGQRYYHYEVFLYRDARVIEAGGTTTSGPVLLVTYNSYQTPEVRFDASTRQSSADTDLYVEALRVRKAVAATSPLATRPGELKVVEIGEAGQPVKPTARPLVQFRGDEQTYDRDKGIITSIGHVYVSQGLVDSAEFLEIRADAAVLFLAPPEAEQPAGATTAPATQPAPEALTLESATPNPTEEALGTSLGREVTGAYLEGNVVLSRGDRMIRAPQLYYDFQNNRALLLDAVMRANVPDRDFAIYVRAKEVRQLSETEFLAEKAIVSTSEFHTPHVHIGAERIRLFDETQRDMLGNVTGIYAGRYQMEWSSLNVEGIPILYWPYSEGSFQQTENLLRSFRTGYGDEFGFELQTKWQLFNLLGLETPKGVDSALRLDYFSDRGPAVGTDLDYETEDRYGLFRGYYIHDTGEDDLGPFRSGKPDTENRGRVLWRHREYLPDDWELTLELSYLSDPNFLEEYFESEFLNDKEQESLVYLKKQKNNWAFTALGQWRLNDFLTQTESFPDLAFHWIGEPIGELGSLYSESHVGYLRYAPDDRRLFNHGRADNQDRSDITFRALTREEVDFPIKLGSVNVVPFAMGRLGTWDGTPHDASHGQAFGSVGVRTGTEFWKLDESIQSDLLDLNGVRHVIRPEALGWLSAANIGSNNLYPFDESIEGIDDFSGALLALRQRWQTKRGGPGRWRLVDWIKFDVELGVFDDAPPDEQPIGHVFAYRPENSIARNHVAADASYRISDTTAIYADANWDLNDGSIDLLNISYAVERTPRFSYFFGYRRIGATDSNLLGFGANYQINSKHTFALREYFDLDRGETETFDITIIRRFPRWYGALTLGLDNINDNISVNISVWPEGLPEAAIGSKRYTGLATSTGINAQQQ